MTASNRSVRPRRAAVLRTRVRRSLDATPSLQSEQKLRRKRAEERERERKREKERERERKNGRGRRESKHTLFSALGEGGGWQRTSLPCMRM